MLSRYRQRRAGVRLPCTNRGLATALWTCVADSTLSFPGESERRRARARFAILRARVVIAGKFCHGRNEPRHNLEDDG